MLSHTKSHGHISCFLQDLDFIGEGTCDDPKDCWCKRLQSCMDQNSELLNPLKNQTGDQTTD